MIIHLYTIPFLRTILFSSSHFPFLAECEDGMHSFKDSCYQFNTDEVTLSTSKANCESIGYHLVYIESSAEQNFLESIVNGFAPNLREERRWIGIERTAQGERVWMDGSTISYSNFREECFQIRQQDAYEWGDHDCSHPHAYICEREGGEYCKHIYDVVL